MDTPSHRAQELWIKQFRSTLLLHLREAFLTHVKHPATQNIQIISALSKFCDLRLTERLGVVLIKHKAIVCSLAPFQTYIVTITLVHWTDLVTKTPEGNKHFAKCISTLSLKSVVFFLCIFKYLKKCIFLQRTSKSFDSWRPTAMHHACK